MVPNFAALGEYTAYSAQARDAAARRRLLAQSLAASIGALVTQLSVSFDERRVQKQIAELAAVDRETGAAWSRANQAAALCGKPALAVDDLLSQCDRLDGATIVSGSVRACDLAGGSWCVRSDGMAHFHNAGAAR